MRLRFGGCLVLLLLSAGCSFFPEKPIDHYQLSSMRHWQAKSHWAFEGRLALSNDKDSLSVSLAWRHRPEDDAIELSGPLAQGRVTVLVAADSVVVDDGDNRQEYYGLVDAIVSEQLGVEMPVASLKYWVLGVNDPAQAFVEQADGFFQGGWLVRYREMQQVGGEPLPKKMIVEKDKTKIKLVVDKWDLL